VSSLHKINQVLLGTKTGIDIKVVLDRVAMIVAGVRVRSAIILKYGT
jgi:hypothetical protein